MTSVEKRIRAWILDRERTKAGVKAPPVGSAAESVGCCGAPTRRLCSTPPCSCNPKERPHG